MRMRASFVRQPRGPLSRSAARNAALLNQCATPGLGSLMAGRRVAGAGQLVLAVAGFGLFFAWFLMLALQRYNELFNDAPPKSVAWLGEAGAGLFIAAWVWSLVTSLSLLRQARAGESRPGGATVVTLAFGLALLSAGALAETPRLVVDDEEYVARVTEAGARLLREGRLKSDEALRRQVRNGGANIRRLPLSRHKLAVPDLCDRLRQSTLAVGNYYRCPECPKWHFNSSAGFVVGERGVVATCCHVVAAEDEGIKESYLIAADAAGRVFPVVSVLAADRESDTCLVRIDAPDLPPLPLRSGVRAGEPVYCLSHPGGYYFMFTEGLVARVTRMRNEVLDEHGRTNGLLTRPILFLNVTAEFAPGASGAPIVDEAGNVVAQVASIADAGEPLAGDTNAPPVPSVPVRFCTAAEEILRLTQADAKIADKGAKTNAPIPRPGTRSRH